MTIQRIAPNTIFATHQGFQCSFVGADFSEMVAWALVVQKHHNPR